MQVIPSKVCKKWLPATQKKVVVIADDYNVVETVQIHTRHYRNSVTRTLRGTAWFNIVRQLDLSRGDKLYCYFARDTDFLHLRVSG